MENNGISHGSVSVHQIEQSREQLHRIVDAQYDLLVQQVLMDGKQVHLEDGEHLMSLAADPARFKGLKPSAVVFPDGRTVSATNWRLTMMEILWDCNKNPAMHEKLMQLRDTVNGRFRSILSSSSAGMNVPLMIDEGLHLEGKLDTEYLLKMVTNNILNAVGYDYDRIGIAVFDPQMELSAHTQEQKM